MLYYLIDFLLTIGMTMVGTVLVFLIFFITTELKEIGKIWQILLNLMLFILLIMDIVVTLSCNVYFLRR